MCFGAAPATDVATDSTAGVLAASIAFELPFPFPLPLPSSLPAFFCPVQHQPWQVLAGEDGAQVRWRLEYVENETKANEQRCLGAVGATSVSVPAAGGGIVSF